MKNLIKTRKRSKQRPRVYQLYTSESGGFRWRLNSSNGRNIRSCGEDYTDRDYCIKMILDDAKGEHLYRIVEILPNGEKVSIQP